VPLPVETFERSGDDTPGTAPIVTVVCGTLASTTVPVVVTVADVGATVVVVPVVDTAVGDVVTVAVVGESSTVPVLDTVTDVVVPLVLALVLPLESLALMVVSSGGGSARATRGPAIEIAVAMTATARVRIAAFMVSSPVHRSWCAHRDLARRVTSTNGSGLSRSVTIR
jgi:hypothetical protein